MLSILATSLDPYPHPCKEILDPKDKDPRLREVLAKGKNCPLLRLRTDLSLPRIRSYPWTLLLRISLFHTTGMRIWSSAQAGGNMPLTICPAALYYTGVRAFQRKHHDAPMTSVTPMSTLNRHSSDFCRCSDPSTSHMWAHGRVLRWRRVRVWRTPGIHKSCGIPSPCLFLRFHTVQQALSLSRPVHQGAKIARRWTGAQRLLRVDHHFHQVRTRGCGLARSQNCSVSMGGTASRHSPGPGAGAGQARGQT